MGGPQVTRQTQERAVLASGDTLDYALGLYIDAQRGLRRMQHGGEHRRLSGDDPGRHEKS